MTRLPSIQRPPLRYHGGKWQLADWIISVMPQHKVYCEPYGGGASVLLSKPSTFLEVYNDLNGDVVNFFSVLRDHTEELVRLIDLTPFSRDEFVRCKKNATADASDIERARRFYVVSWQSRGAAGMQEQGGWRHVTKYGTRHNTPGDDFNNTGHLYAVAQRLKKCQIENLPALDCIVKYDSPDTLHYVDPPYVLRTRGAKGTLHRYRYDMEDGDHIALLATLKTLKGMVILSGYDDPIYHELLPEWAVHKKEVSKDNHAGKAKEVLWVSPNAVLPGIQQTIFLQQ